MVRPAPYAYTWAKRRRAGFEPPSWLHHKKLTGLRVSLVEKVKHTPHIDSICTNTFSLLAGATQANLAHPVSIWPPEMDVFVWFVWCISINVFVWPYLCHCIFWIIFVWLFLYDFLRDSTLFPMQRTSNSMPSCPRGQCFSSQFCPQMALKLMRSRSGWIH